MMKTPFRLLHLVFTCIAAGVMVLYPAAWADEEKGYWQLERAVLVRPPKLDFPDCRVISGIIPNGMQNKIEFKQNNQVYNPDRAIWLDADPPGLDPRATGKSDD